ncbi:MAG TPA: hypothetical protein VLG50_03180 [Candidatus Saccharimonadales bacterium]|nr:hypothetical protein [Candidatus Saccharimonadales bacterium]
MKHITLVSLFLFSSATEIFGSQNNQQQQNYTDYLDQRILARAREEELKLLEYRRKQEHQLVKLEEAEQTYKKTEEAYQEAYQKNKEAFFEKIMWKHRNNPCLQDCAIVVNSPHCPFITSSGTCAICLLGNAFLSCPHPLPPTPTDPLMLPVVVNLAGAFISATIGCLVTSVKCDEFSEYKKKHPLSQLSKMHTIPAATCRDKMV